MNFPHSFDQNDLIAYHLHELSPRRYRALRRALELNPALAAESEAIASTLRALHTGQQIPTLDAAILERNWQRLRPSLLVLEPQSPAHGWRKPFAMGAGLAALAAAILFVSWQRHPLALPASTASLAPSPLSTTDQSAPIFYPTSQSSARPYNNRPGPLTTAPVSTGLHNVLLLSYPDPLDSSAPSDLQAQLSAVETPSLPDLAPLHVSQPKPLPAPAAPTRTARRHVETTFSLGIGPQLTATRLTGDYAYPVQSLDPSPSVLGTVRQSFRSWLGYSVNLGYTRTTQHNIINPLYISGYSTTLTRFDIPANLYEVSAAYHAQKHLNPKLTGFVDLGAGALTFLPVHRGPDAANYVPNKYPSLIPPVTFRPLGVGAVGADYHFTPKLALRAEYRGLLYKYPDYGIGLPRPLTLSSQPTLSLTYTPSPKPKH